jgi:peptidoglycan-associated lipoprotein
LNGLAKVLKDNPDISVEIDSHTDTRGDFEINKYISQQRAQSVVNYLSLNGISLKRLTAKGYGKERPLIPCSSGDRCTEADQAKNRRTEFKVIKIGEQSLF